MRLVCPNNPAHSDFYLRRTYSESWNVSPEGGIATRENKNSMDSEGDSPIYCNSCEDLAWKQREHNSNWINSLAQIPVIKTPVEVIDNDPGAAFFEDDSL